MEKNRFKEKIKNTKILVIGDIMLDRYIWGEVKRISPEAPVPIVRVIKEDCLLGGAANVVNNLLSLGVKTDLCGVIGNDLNGDIIKKLLKEKKLSTNGIFSSKEKVTIVKTRVIAHKQQIVRVDREDNEPLKKNIYKKILEYLANKIEDYDAVIISDYGKGLISKSFYKKIVEICNKFNKIIAIDPKQSNMNIYKKATFLTPNLNEASYAAQMQINLKNIEKAGKKLLKKFQSSFLVITLGELGMAIFTDDGEFIHIPTVAKEVYDVTGAGDTVIAVITMCMASGFDIVESAKIANLAAGIVVGKVGTATVTFDELAESIENI